MKKDAFTPPSLSPKKMAKREEKKPIRTWSRSTRIQPSFLSKTFQVHNGKSFLNLLITEEMLGYKLGEFARTRKRGKDPRPKKANPKKPKRNEIKTHGTKSTSSWNP